MLSLELSTIQAKDADRQMLAEAMAKYTGPITIVAEQRTESKSLPVGYEVMGDLAFEEYE